MTDLYPEALQRLQQLLERLKQPALHEPTAVSLATADAQGRPSVRTVLLKQLDARGAVFFTNLQSRKARQLDENPRAALGLFADSLMEQAMLEGNVERIADVEADAYWATRERISQLGAWASRQSAPLDRRETLEVQLAECESKFAGGPVPRPPHWSGYRVAPDRIEFWIARPFRLNERTLYERRAGRWTKILLYP